MSKGILVTLREHLKNGDEYHLIDKNNAKTADITSADKIAFGLDAASPEISLSLEDLTDFSIEGKAVVLRVIVHCWMHKDSSAADYLADCQKLHLMNISFLQRNDLLNWLSGQTETSQYITGQNKAVTSTTEATEATVASTEKSNKTAASARTSESKASTTTTTSGLSNIEIIQKDDPVLYKNLQEERTLVDHNSSLRGNKPIDFRYLIKDVELKLIPSLKGSSSKSGRASKGHVSKTKASSKSVLSKEPIILISSATSSMLTLANIKDFLEQSKYVSPKDITVTSNKDTVIVEKKFEKISKPIRFLIVNNPNRFTKPEYWDRLVAVFTTGHTWQFSNYHWNTPQELFQHCNGYYFHFNGDEVPKHVQQWNVQRIALDKHQRFKDIEAVRTFWTSLEKTLLARGYH
ncbi:accessory factor associated with RNA polymerase II [Maudiozyma exigua]|uniref:Accessory factor associated with RNA polymerase II n=1 Tax=Maudiozyma exigua TaxID=34358 RepID=A0A9P7BDQ0_MAUEX|nr:accessory factor associated with RNA polymerase II [Kazachstania exigua]